ncbi:MAG: hypothetical protein IH897_12300 [Planctomycetes bacterium]|nr:hypothetical protein [Planctomycetota bacterium]
MKYETAGEPIGGLKWTRKTTKRIAVALVKRGIEVSRNTVGRLLKQMDFRLRVNHKKRSTASPRERDKQFRLIHRRRNEFIRKGDPIVSVDTKKRELVGNFRNSGTAWKQEAMPTLATDFRSDAEGVAIPYGLYDPVANRGFVVVGTSRETPAFAVDGVVTARANIAAVRHAVTIIVERIVTPGTGIAVIRHTVAVAVDRVVTAGANVAVIGHAVLVTVDRVVAAGTDIATIEYPVDIAIFGMAAVSRRQVQRHRDGTARVSQGHV